MTNWLLLSTNGKASGPGKAPSCENSLTESALLTLLEDPADIVSAHERPSRGSLQHVRAKGCRLAVCPGGRGLDPGFSQMWTWAQELANLGVHTVCPAASGLRRDRVARGSLFGSASVALSVCDATTQKVVFDTLGVRVTFVGHPALVPGVLFPAHHRDEAVVVSFHPTQRENQVEWYGNLVRQTKRPVRVLVHEDKDWSFAGRLASYAPWAQVVDVSEIHTLEQWAKVLSGWICLGSNEAEAIGAAALQVPSALLFPTSKHEIDLNGSAAGMLGISQGVIHEQNQYLDPQQVLDSLVTIPYDDASAHVQSLMEWLYAAQLPVRQFNAPQEA